MYAISKTFDFCYGHRVWTQELNAEYSLDSCLKCRHLHGHQGLIRIYLGAAELHNGMVTDFKHLNWFKKWLDHTLDHKFIMHSEDPLLNKLFPLHSKFVDQFDSLSGCFVADKEKLAADKTLSGAEIELYEGLVIVPFVPTSENLTKWIYDFTRLKMKQIQVEVIGVEFNETPKSQSGYMKD
jgi:6-pyruvoyltetrahydropterin/6-carboxytetrahydropterin synthase